MKKLILSACLLLVAIPSISMAVMVDGPYTTSTPIASTKTDWTGSLAFPKFNSALGTLLSVKLEVTAAYDTVLTITNTASSASNGWVKTELLVSVMDAGNNLVDPVLDLLTAQYDFNLNPGESTTSGTLHKQGTSNDTYTSAAVLSAFNGPGTITLNAGTTTYAVISYTGGNTEAAQSTYASTTGQVTYTYEPVPEPATLTILGMGAVALLRRRR